ncbi:DUF6794 domain-containing protein [Undibacterium sp. TJN19]|uniref:DUF6794 domain-containing protein n=1 Tax=Undibacterium sp. TJN19 TaxID=3413055 RepID=UPI003BF0F12F
MKFTLSGICFAFTTAVAAYAIPAYAQDTATQAANAANAANASSPSQATATCATPGKNGYDKTCKRYPDADTWPTSCDQAATDILAKLDDASKQRVKDSSYEGLTQFHMYWGMGIRNDTGLWRGNVALTDSCMAMRKDISRHPDEISMVIIQEIWKKLH